jgi:hypothetical protein
MAAAITTFMMHCTKALTPISVPDEHDEELPPFAELESHLLNIDDSCGLTLPSQNQHNYNHNANIANQYSSNQPLEVCSSRMQLFTTNNIKRPHKPYSGPNNPAPAHQDITIMMVAELQPNNIALFNNRTAAHNHPSELFHPATQTKGVLQ